MPRMIGIAQNDKGIMLAQYNHKRCNGGTGIQGYKREKDVLIPILCDCVVFVPKKENSGEVKKDAVC